MNMFSPENNTAVTHFARQNVGAAINGAIVVVALAMLKVDIWKALACGALFYLISIGVFRATARLYAIHMLIFAMLVWIGALPPLERWRAAIDHALMTGLR